MTCKFLPSALTSTYRQVRSFYNIALFKNTLSTQHSSSYSLPSVKCQAVRRQFHTSPLRNDNYDDERRTRSLPVLMKNHTELIWPKIFKSLGNMIAAHLIVKPYFDNDFSLPEFVKGAKFALMVIANSLAKGDVDSLEGLVDKDALSEIRWNVSRCSLSQLSQLAIYDSEEIYLSFPYKLGIIMNDTDKGIQERFVEITMCYHVFRGLPDLIKSGEFRPGPTAMRQHQDKITICNYRFIREFTKGVEGQWIVNMIHHFNLADAD